MIDRRSFFKRAAGAFLGVLVAVYAPHTLRFGGPNLEESFNFWKNAYLEPPSSNLTLAHIQHVIDMVERQSRGATWETR